MRFNRRSLLPSVLLLLCLVGTLFLLPRFSGGDPRAVAAKSSISPASAGGSATAVSAGGAERVAVAAAGSVAGAASNVGAVSARAASPAPAGVAADAGDLPESASPEVDFARNHIVIDGHRAHPHRLLGRVREGAAASAAAASTVATSSCPFVHFKLFGIQL